MASTSVQTEGMDLTSWLKANDMTDLAPKLKQSKLKLHDLLQCGKQDIRDLCKENNWGTVTRIKLISALSSTTGSSINSGEQKLIFLGEKEKEILDQIYKKAEVISNDMDSIQKAINGLERSAVECNKQIHAKCDELVSMIDKKRKALLDTVSTLKNKRRSELQAALKQLEEMNETVMKSQQTAKEVACKTDISSSSRLEPMQAVMDKQQEMEQKIDFDEDEMQKSEIRLVVRYQPKSFDANFKSVLNVQFNEDEMELKYSKKTGAKVEILAFSTEYKSADGLQLSDNNKCVKKVNGTRYKYILADVQPVTTGVHCWRVQTKNPKPRWIAWGVSQQKKFGDGSYSDSSAYIAATGLGHIQWYPIGGTFQHNSPTFTQFNGKEIEVDMCLDVDNGTLKLCVVTSGPIG